jgi:hypothetical protein
MISCVKTSGPNFALEHRLGHRLPSRPAASAARAVNLVRTYFFFNMIEVYATCRSAIESPQKLYFELCSSSSLVI